MQTSDVGKSTVAITPGSSSGADTPIQDRGEGSSERLVLNVYWHEKKRKTEE